MIPDKYLYLTIDLLSILFPFLFSFYPKANFSRKWKYLWPSIIVTAALFVLWDIKFTAMGIWGFNPRYLTGVSFYNLPLEEVLFFICIPYACVFTYEAVGYVFKTQSGYLVSYVTYTLIVFLFIVGLLNLDRWYTVSTFLSGAVFLIFLKTIVKPNYLGRFYVSFLIILLPFFIVNGILTGTGIEEQVVYYNDSENLGIRIGTIPFEDIFYGLLLLLMNVSIFEALQKKSLRRAA